LSSVKARYLKINFDEILLKLRQYAKSKAETHKVKAIVLAGSLAKGTYSGASDADILVIADNLPGDILKRYALFSEPTMPIDVEPIVYTPDEFAKKVRQGDRFAVESLKTGIPLYGEQFLNDLRKSITDPSHR